MVYMLFYYRFSQEELASLLESLIQELWRRPIPTTKIVRSRPLVPGRGAIASIVLYDQGEPARRRGRRKLEPGMLAHPRSTITWAIS